MAAAVVLNSPRLSNFLADSTKSGHRERMFRHRLLYDVHEAFARAGSQVQVYDAEVDVAGFDIILDNLITFRRFQLKTVGNEAETSEWKIHRYLLAPDIHYLNQTPFAQDSGGHGYMGGVILTIIDLTDDIVKIRYFYTDAFVICGMRFGIFAPRHPNQMRAVDAVFTQLTEPTCEKAVIWLRKCCFWEMRDMDSLLKVAGFQLAGDTVAASLRDVIASLIGQRPDLKFGCRDAAVRYVENELRPYLARCGSNISPRPADGNSVGVFE